MQERQDVHSCMYLQERAGIESSVRSIQQMSSAVVQLAAQTRDHAQANGHS